MSSQVFSAAQAEALLPYATDAQARCIIAYISAGANASAAGRALKFTRDTVRSALRAARARAALRGFSPEHGWNPPAARTATAGTVPEGFELGALSDFVNADGERKAAWLKFRQSADPKAHEPIPPSFLVNSISEMTDAKGDTRIRWTSYSQADVDKWDSLFEALRGHMSDYVEPVKPTPAPHLNDDSLLTVYAVGDAHLGMFAWSRETGENFDLKIAERELVHAVDMLIERTPPSKNATFLNVGDWFHVQGDEQRTPTSGVKLDADSRFGKIAEIGFRTMRRCVDALLKKHEVVTVVSVPGNHDPHMARMLAMWMRAVYENEPRVVIEDNNHPYLYQVHGKNLIGYFHGDGAKFEAMMGIMATDKPKEWGAAEFRFWYGGHVHHKIRKEFTGGTVETFNTLAPKDYWHTHRGYRSQQSMTAITHDAEYGEITRSTVDVRLVRAVGVKL